MTARPLPSRKPSRSLRVIPGGRPARAPVGTWVLFTLAVVVAFFALIYSRTALDRSAFVLDELEEQIALEEARYEELRLEVARLESPQRVLEAAEEMGMVFPAQVETVTAPGVVGPEPGPAEGRWAQVKSVLSARP